MEASPRATSFGQLAEEYHRWRPSYPGEAVDWLAPPAPAHVAELGAGTGKLTERLLARGLTVDAVEPDARMLAVLARHSPDSPPAPRRRVGDPGPGRIPCRRARGRRVPLVRPSRGAPRGTPRVETRRLARPRLERRRETGRAVGGRLGHRLRRLQPPEQVQRGRSDRALRPAGGRARGTAVRVVLGAHARALGVLHGHDLDGDRVARRRASRGVRRLSRRAPAHLRRPWPRVDADASRGELLPLDTRGMAPILWT